MREKSLQIDGLAAATDQQAVQWAVGQWMARRGRQLL